MGVPPCVLTVGAEFTDSRSERCLVQPPKLHRPRQHQHLRRHFRHTRQQCLATRIGRVCEDNIALTEHTRLIPTLRFDHHSKSGGNVSGGLNFSQQLGEYWLVKGGIARA